MSLQGLRLKYFRAFGPKEQTVSRFGRINCFVGANNSGKSAILELMHKHVPRVFREKKAPTLDPVEYFRGPISGEFWLSAGVSWEFAHEQIVKYVNERRDPSNVDNRFYTGLGEVLKALADDGLIWIERKSGADFTLSRDTPFEEAKGWTRFWFPLFNGLTYHTGADISLWVPRVLAQIAGHCVPSIPDVFLVPAKRQIGQAGEKFEDLSGRGLIDKLAELQNPGWERRADRLKFDEINLFVREVTGKADAQLEVPSDRRHLLVHIDNKVLPLAALGTGIHEVILLAAFCTVNENSILCIEEPEIHLHPVLQRKLISYLGRKTNNQYFLATHSPSIIDSDEANVFHVWNDGAQSFVRAVPSRITRGGILDELGYLSSDLLQSNAVIWVEGPSDRLYLNNWIGSVDQNLREGIEYSVMFYGGALLRHLSASSEAAQEFVELRKINRNMLMLVDSDRAFEGDTLKPAVKRLHDEFADREGLWITQGREVENYIEPEIYQSALRDTHPRLYDSPYRRGSFDHAFYFWTRNGERKLVVKTANKVAVAQRLCEHRLSLDVLDLEARVRATVRMIRRANGLAELT